MVVDHGTERTVKCLRTVKRCHIIALTETDDDPKGGKEKLPRIVRGTTLVVGGFETVGISAGGVPRVGKFKRANETKNSTITSRGRISTPASLLINRE